MSLRIWSYLYLQQFQLYQESEPHAHLRCHAGNDSLVLLMIATICNMDVNLIASVVTFSTYFFACWVTVHATVAVCWLFFSKLSFSKIYFRSTIRVSNSSDSDQDRRFVGPDLGPNCLQRLFADDKSSRLI